MLINATPHDVLFYTEAVTQYAASVRKLILTDPEARPYRVIPKSGLLLNAKEAEVIEDDPIDGVPTKRVVYEVDPLPAGDETYIVSALYKSAAPTEDHPRLLTVGGVVYASASDPKPVGCTYLRR